MEEELAPIDANRVMSPRSKAVPKESAASRALWHGWEWVEAPAESEWGSGSTWQGAPAGSAAGGKGKGGQDAPARSSAGGKGKGGKDAPAGSSAGGKGKGAKRCRGGRREEGGWRRDPPAAQLRRRELEDCLQVACTLSPVEIRMRLSAELREELHLPADEDPTIAFVWQAAARGVKFTYRLRKGREYATAYLSDDDREKQHLGPEILHDVMTDWLSILEACGEDLAALRLPAFYGQVGQPTVLIPWYTRFVPGRLRSRAERSTAETASTAPAGSAAAPGSAAGPEPRITLRGTVAGDPPRAGSAARVGHEKPRTQHFVASIQDVRPSIRGKVDTALREKQMRFFKRGYHLHVETNGVSTERGAPQATGPAQDIGGSGRPGSEPYRIQRQVWNAPRGIRTLSGSPSVRLWGSSPGAGRLGALQPGDRRAGLGEDIWRCSDWTCVGKPSLV